MSVLIHDNADKVPPPAPGRHPLTPISGADFERRASGRLPAQAWLIISVAALAPVGLLLWGVYRAVESALLDHPWLGSAIGLVLLVMAGAGLVGAAGTLGARAWLAVQHARVIRTRHGVPVDVVAQMRLDPAALEAQQLQLEALRAPYLQHPNLSTLSSSGSGAKAEAPAQLAAPTIDLTPVAADTWLSWIERVPHVMLAAKTGKGKTATALHMLAPRAQAGEQFAIIDPHSGDWGGLPIIGGGEDWPTIASAMEQIIALYGERLQERERHKTTTGRELPHDYFPRLTILFDEAWLACVHLDTPARRGEKNIWERFMPVMGSGARKVSISLWPMTQTANVNDIGMSGPERENFTRIALDMRACRLLANEEPSATRRSAILEALSGMEWPALSEYDGQMHFLDRSGMDTLPDLTLYVSQVWQPGPIVAQPSRDDVLLRALAAAKSKGYTREQARASGLRFTDALWGDV